MRILKATALPFVILMLAPSLDLMHAPSLDLLFLEGLGFAGEPEPSQIRQENETWRDAASRYQRQLEEGGLRPARGVISAEDAAVPIQSLDLSSAPEWSFSETGNVLQGNFEKMRDLRFLILPEMRHFNRRISWLYPDDGCYARAEWMGFQLENWNLPRPKKLFIFGNLKVKSRNSPKGRVYWWYHVVPVLLWKPTEKASPDAYVMDPTIEPRHPLQWLEWVQNMVSDPEEVRLAVCDSTAYAPSSDCYSPEPESLSRARRDQKRFLRLEWKRLVDLDRDPDEELGEQPPWLNP